MKETVLQQNRLRTGWVKTPEELASYFEEEYQEMLDATAEVLIGADPLTLIQELADVYILYVQLEEMQIETEEQIDKTLSVLFLCDEMGIDIDEAVALKTLRNTIKYPVDLLRQEDKTKEEMIKECKSLYSAMGGDRAFYEYVTNMYE